MSSTQVRATCPHDCPDTCALLVTVEDGVATEVKGDPDHPTTAGVLCTKVSRYTERTYAPDRLLYPLRRTGKKGEGKFERISWEQALDEIAARLQPLAATEPESILPYSYAGTMGLVQGDSMSSRFFHKLGASLLDRTICATAGATGYKYTVGASIGTDIEQFQNAKLLIIWGGNPIASNLHFWTRAQEAKRNGAKLIAIDPYRSLTAEKCHQHIAVLPGTDAALALGLMHILCATTCWTTSTSPTTRWALRSCANAWRNGRRSAWRKPAVLPSRKWKAWRANMAKPPSAASRSPSA